MAKRFGTLMVWIASEHGGFGFVNTSDGGRFFLHRNWIVSGDPRPGSPIVFEVLPPANPTAKFPRAINATINANTPGARETKIQPKIATNVSSPTAATVSP